MISVYIHHVLKHACYYMPPYFVCVCVCVCVPEAMGVQYLSELRLRMGPTGPCREEELMTDGPWRSGVIGAAAEVGG